MHTAALFWIGFHAVVLILLAIDLFGLHGKMKVVTMREAAISSMVWIALAMAFGAWIHHAQGAAKGMEFFTGYVIEYSLSIDNLFVFIMIFSAFKVPREHQHRVLVWGILGALVMRGAIIAVGVQLIRRFEWLLYGFGVFLLLTGLRMLFKKEGTKREDNFVIRLCRKIPRVTSEFDGSRFITRSPAGWMLTPLAVVLVVLDVMDLAFAADSIPAVFAVTTDPFIVYTSNICAILGLRSLYFLLAGVAHRFKYLHYGLAAVLTFIGLKMLLAGVWHIPNDASLCVVAALLALSIVASLCSRES